jgi:hypothetical protein
LASGSPEDLIYAALELRTGVEVRLKQYLDYQHHVPAKLRRGYQIPNLGKTAQNTFKSSEIVGRFTFFDAEGRELAKFLYTPVTKSLQVKAERCGDYLHALNNARVGDEQWWQELRSLLAEGLEELRFALQGTLLGMPLVHLQGKMHMPFEYEGERPMPSVGPGVHVKFNAEYIPVKEFGP